jgi:hypothetical protein
MGKLHKKVKKFASKLGPISFSPGHMLSQTAAKSALGEEKYRKYNPIDGGIDKLQQDTFDDTHPLGTEVENQYDARKEAEAAATAEANKPVIPLPDEEELARVRRRRSRRGTGRSSTVLTDQERFGV